MSEEEERLERRIARRVQHRQRKLLGYAAGFAGGVGLLALASMYFDTWRTSGILQPAASFLLATSVVAAASYLGDPVKDPGRRNREERTAASQFPLRLWLGCFVAIWAGITATQVLPGLIVAATVPAPRGFSVQAPTGAVVRVAAGTRTSQISVRLPEGGAGREAVSVRLIK